MRTVVIAVGGTIGSLARYAISRGVSTHHGFPTATLIVNVVGAFLIAVVLTRVKRETLWQPFVAVGVLGGFTTFSALAEQVADEHSGVSLIYLAVTVLSGVVAVNLGARVRSGA